MKREKLPVIIEPEMLIKEMENNELLVVDLSTPESYAHGHLSGAVFLEYAWIVAERPPYRGLLPDEEQLSNVLGSLGIKPDTQIIAYDTEGGGRASRFLWTLDVVGHKFGSLLNGGLTAWVGDGLPVEQKINYPTPGKYQAKIESAPVADRNFILENLNNEKIALLDARSPAEFNGRKLLAERGGHIPGAVNFEWTQAVDKSLNLRLKPKEELLKTLKDAGITRDKTIITYCQTHHRSSHTYIVLKSLGYEKVKGYPGSWSDWGNSPDTPIEN